MQKAHPILAGLILLGLLWPGLAVAEAPDFINVALSSTGAYAYDNGSFADYGRDEDAMQAIDGDPLTYWAGLQSRSPQIMTIGFASPQLINRIRIQENRVGSYFTNARFEYYRNGWHELFTADKTAPGLDQPFFGVEADSVRMKVITLVAPVSWYNKVACISEFEVNALPPLPNNVALLSRGAWAYDDGSFGGNGIDQDAVHAIDDDPATYWAGLQGAAPQTMTIGFASRQIIERIRIQETPWAYFTSATFEFYDGNWKTLFTADKNGPDLDRSFAFSIADSVRMTIHSVVAPPSWYNQVACIIAFEVDAVAPLVPDVALGSFAYDNGFLTYGVPHEAADAVDGDPLTYWAGLEYRSPQTMTVGFEGPRQIDRIRVWEFWGGGDISYFTDADFEYYDGNSWNQLLNHRKSASHMDVMFPTVIADSVRIRVNALVAPGSWYNRVACISDVEVHGTPVYDISGNVASASRWATAYDNGYFDDYGPIRDAAKAIDGDPDTYWAGLESRGVQVLTVGFVRSCRINRLVIEENYGVAVSYFNTATFEYFDGSRWVWLHDAAKSVPGYDMSFAPVIADSVRMTINSVTAPYSWYNRVACISEFAVFSDYLADVGEGLAVTAPILGGLSNHPNPFNPVTTIRYRTTRNAHVDVAVYDMRGRLIRTLHDGVVAQGDHAVSWDGADRSGQRMASGTYFCRIASGSEQEVIKLQLVK